MSGTGGVAHTTPLLAARRAAAAADTMPPRPWPCSLQWAQGPFRQRSPTPRCPSGPRRARCRQTGLRGGGGGASVSHLSRAEPGLAAQPHGPGGGDAPELSRRHRPCGDGLSSRELLQAEGGGRQQWELGQVGAIYRVYLMLLYAIIYNMHTTSPSLAALAGPHFR